MTITIYENNQVRLTGRITRKKMYSEKASNIVLAINSGVDANGQPKSQYITLKCFNNEAFDSWTVGMLVTAYCHLSANTYEKDGETIYSQDVVVDSIIFGEAKEVVANREAIKAMNN